MMPLVQSLPTGLGAAAVLPALMLLWLVVATDRRPEPPGLVWSAFLLGVAAIFLTGYARAPLVPLVHLAGNVWSAAVARAVFLAAIPEETAKIAVIWLLITRLRAVHEPMDGLVYGAAVGLGFAAWENLGFLLNFADAWRDLAIMRNLVTVPLHGALGMIAGGYLAAARFSGALGGRHHAGRTAAARLIARAWLIPVALHAGFDISLLGLRDDMGVGTAGTIALAASGLAIGLGAVALAVRLALRLAAHQHPMKSGRRVPAEFWRYVWALALAGAVSGFAGAAIVASAIHRAWLGGSVEPAPLLAGVVMLAAAAVVFRWSRTHLIAKMA